MTSDKQFDANRANAQLSTGPRTEEGRLQSRLNAARHPVTGQVDVLTEEDRKARDKFEKEIIADLAPDGAVERSLASLYASYQWRLQRSATLEEGLFTLGFIEDTAANFVIEHPDAHDAIGKAVTYRNQSQAFDRLSMYNHRLVNQSAKVFKQLHDLQTERKKTTAQQLYEATAAYQLHQMKAIPFDPKDIGFEFSTHEIRLNLRRREVRTEAWHASQCNWDAAKHNETWQKSAA